MDELDQTVERINDMAKTIADTASECANEHILVKFHGPVCPVCTETKVSTLLRAERDKARADLERFTENVNKEREKIKASLDEMHGALRGVALKMINKLPESRIITR